MGQKFLKSKNFGCFTVFFCTSQTNLFGQVFEIFPQTCCAFWRVKTLRSEGYSKALLSTGGSKKKTRLMWGQKATNHWTSKVRPFLLSFFFPRRGKKFLKKKKKKKKKK